MRIFFSISATGRFDRLGQPLWLRSGSSRAHFLQMVKAVIFDVDGTLIDSVDLHARAWQETFLKYGVTTGFQAVRAEIGKGGDKIMQTFLAGEHEPLLHKRGKEIEEAREKLFKSKYLSQVRPFPGLKDLFKQLRSDDITIALASSAKGDELKVYKKITGVEPFLAKETSSDDVASSKPDPDIFSAAQKKLGISPKDIIAVGDSEYDAESAGKVGIATIGLLCGSSGAAELRKAGSIEVYRDPADLLANYGDSPLKKAKGSHSSLHFLIGLGVGATVGFLVAPKSGIQMRR